MKSLLFSFFLASSAYAGGIIGGVPPSQPVDGGECQRDVSCRKGDEPSDWMKALQLLFGWTSDADPASGGED